MAKRKKQAKRPDTTSTYSVLVKVTAHNEGGVAPATPAEVAMAVEEVIEHGEDVGRYLFEGITVTDVAVTPYVDKPDAGEE